jgi:hypothetical protein
MEGKMGKFNKHQGDRERFGKCEICMGAIPVEYYFGIGDEIICYECGTSYTIAAKVPIKLQITEGYYEDDYFDNSLFEGY